jgi:hypothetical protein
MIPPDHEMMNDKRSSAAKWVLESFALDFGEIGKNRDVSAFAEQNLVDFIADLAHFCDRSGLNLEKCICVARSHYADETNNLGEQLSVRINLRGATKTNT